LLPLPSESVENRGRLVLLQVGKCLKLQLQTTLLVSSTRDYH
jgi:hypothetical protein